MLREINYLHYLHTKTSNQEVPIHQVILQNSTLRSSVCPSQVAFPFGHNHQSLYSTIISSNSIFNII